METGDTIMAEDDAREAADCTSLSEADTTNSLFSETVI